MLRKPLKVLLMASFLVILLGGAWSVQANSPAASPPRADADLTLAIKSTKKDRDEALQVWTRQARHAAKAMTYPTTFQEAESENVPEGSGAAGFAPGGKANPQAKQRARRQFAADWRVSEGDYSGEALLEPEGTAKVFTAYLVNFFAQMRTDFPYSAIGKLYITGEGYCTASVISPNNIIVTAAHCVYDTVANKWFTGWIFVPADNNGAAPYGAFPWVSARILTAWKNASGAVRRYDIALITMDKNSNGDSLSSSVGWLGRSWNFSYIQHMHAFGYPSNIDSRYTRACAAESFSGGTDVLGMGCDMTYGSSGGPWIRVFTPYQGGARNFVNSVVSGGTPGTKTFYGARFSSSNIVPLCNAQGC